MDGQTLSIGLFLLNILLGIAGWAMKSQITDLKAEVVKNRVDIDNVRDKYFKKEDFSDFKKELWSRLDRFEQDVKDQLHKN
mgnify:CR=1 FL=1